MNTEKIKQVVYEHPTIFAISVVLLLLALFQLDFDEKQWRDNRGRTQLYLAAENGDLDKVRLLLEDVQNPDQRDDCKWTPLMRAAQNRHLEVSTLLIDAGADVNARDKGGYSILMVVSALDNVEVLELLLKNDVKINEQDDSLGWTALIWSAKEGHINNVAALLEAGADTHIKDSTGKTAYDWAIENEFSAIAEKLNTQN